MSIFQNAGARWNLEEDEQLKNLFLNHGMSIEEISKIHKRTVLAITQRLIKNKLIEDPNFIKTELLNLEKTNRGDNAIVLLSEILSKHISEINEKLDLINTKLNKFSILDDIDE